MGASPRLALREAPLDLRGWGVEHPRPCLLDLLVEPGAMSGVVEHVSNVEYVRWLDRAAELHADALGYTRQRLLDDGVMWFVARHEVDYLAEARLGDRLVIATWVRDMRRVRSWRDSLIVRPADGAAVCRASTLWVLVRLRDRRPVRIDDEMIRRFAPLEGPPRGAGAATGAGPSPCTSP